MPQKIQNKKDLEIHIRIDAHSKTTFKCDLCNNEFSVKSNLKHHIESVHEKKNFTALFVEKDSAQS